MIKVLWCKLQRCLCMFTMLLVEGSSETRFFRHLSDYVFGDRNLGNTKPMTASFFSNCSKFNLVLGNAEKRWEKVFRFGYNCIWVGIVKLYLLRAGYLLSAAIVLTSRPKIRRSWKTSLLLTCQILGLLLNTLAGDEMYPVLNRDNLTIPVQMQLSQQKKLFPNFLLHNWVVASILNILKKKRLPS